MEFEGDSPAPRSPAPTEPVGPQNITVTPENVVALAVLFRGCADRIQVELGHVERATSVSGIGLDDPVSRWFEQRFSEYLNDGENPFVQILRDVYDRYADVTRALISIGEKYQLTEDLVAAGFVDVGEPR